MKNALAVYTSKPSLSGRKFVGVVRDHGITVRFLALGGYIPGNADEVQEKSLAAVNGGALLVVGAFESDKASLDRFDELIERADRAAITAMLKAAELPWCELYTGRFSHAKAEKGKPTAMPSIDGSAAHVNISALKAAKTRYVIYNQSRKKNGERLMVQLAHAVAKATDGIIAEHQKPSR